MASPGVQFEKSTAQRIVDKVRRAENTPDDRTGLDVYHKYIPRAYREFELTEELSGGVGSTAAVKWLRWNNPAEEIQDSGETGEVFDHLGTAWGIEGERGEARRLGDRWVVSRNPGRPVYHGKLDGDLDSGSSAVMSVWEGATLADSGVNITIYDASSLVMITASKKIASGVAVTAMYDGTKFYLNVPGACEIAQ
jgi:hypothetical protein